MARDFPGGTNTDRVVVANYAAIQSLDTLSFCVWGFQDGSNNYGRLAAKSNTSDLAGFNWYNEQSLGQTNLSFTRWATTFGAWHYPKPSLNVWHHHLVTYDYGSTVNDPVCYVDGVSQTVTEDQTPVGTLNADTNDLYIGNRIGGSSNRCWEGALAHFAMWNRVLSANEAKTVYRRGPGAVPNGRVSWLSLLGWSPERNFASGGNTGAVTGTTVIAGPSVLAPFGLRRRSQVFVAAGGATYQGTGTDGLTLGDSASGQFLAPQLSQVKLIYGTP